MKLLIGTSKGCLLWEDGHITKLFSGRIYGITKQRDQWYAAADGQIVRIPSGEKVMDCVFASHQIDFVDDLLVVAATADNQIEFYNRWNLVHSVAPNGHKGASGLLPQHLHLNSVFSYKDDLYVMAHNLSNTYKRPSEMYVYDIRTFALKYKKELIGRSCHNLFVDAQGITYLDSDGGRVIRNSEQIAVIPGFLRGLAITSDYCIVGASGTGKRHERERKGGALVITDRQFRKLQEYPLDAPILEVRCMDQPDYSLSNTLRIS